MVVDPAPDRLHTLAEHVTELSLTLRWVLESGLETPRCHGASPYTDMLAELGLTLPPVLAGVPRVGPVEPWSQDTTVLRAGERVLELLPYAGSLPLAEVADVSGPLVPRLAWRGARRTVRALSILVVPVDATHVAYAPGGAWFTGVLPSEVAPADPPALA